MFDSEDFKERLINPADVDALMAMGAFEKVEAEKTLRRARLTLWLDLRGRNRR
jgi:hypothetical protein